MPQYPLNYPLQGGTQATFAVVAPTVIKASNGIVATINVIVAGSAVGAVYDNNSASGNSISNQIAAIPNTVGSYSLDAPVRTGITIVPGTGQTVSVTYL